MARYTYRICYACKEKKPLGKYSRSECTCNDCMKLGIVIPKKVEIKKCSECGTEFGTLPSQDKKFCSNECYHAYLLSDKNPRRGVPLKHKRHEVAPLRSSKSDEIASHNKRCTATLKTFGEITKVCKQLSISYGQYQMYKESGELERMLKKSEGNLF